MRLTVLIFTIFLMLSLQSEAQIKSGHDAKAPVASFTSGNFCLGDQTTFTNTSTDYSFVHWDFGDNIDTYGNEVQHQYEATGTYTVTLTAYDASGVPDVTTQDIIINDLPALTLTLDGEPTFYIGNTRTITANGSFVGAEWTNLLDNTWTQTGASVGVTESGQYHVVITDLNGCKNSADTTLVAISRPTEESEFKITMLNNILTPNGDAINDFLKIDQFETYVSAIEIFIYNIQGDLVYSNTAYENDWNGSSNGKLLPAGTYYYIVRSLGRDGGTGYIDILR